MQWLRLIWSQSPFDLLTSGPPLPVPMDKWSPKFWSPWTNGPQPIWSPWTNSPHQIWSPWTNVPKKFGPPGQMVPNQFGPYISKSSQLVPLDKQNILGTICPGGPNWLGPFVHGDRIFWDHLSMGTELVGDCLSRETEFFGTICPWGQEVGGPEVGGPEVRGSNGFGIKCITAFQIP